MTRDEMLEELAQLDEQVANGTAHPAAGDRIRILKNELYSAVEGDPNTGTAPTEADWADLGRPDTINQG